MDEFIAGGLHDKERFPDCGDDGGGPKGAGCLTAKDVLLVEVVVLEASPFGGESTLKNLAPANVLLLLEEGLVEGGILGNNDGGVTKP
jgi:hypothetical protein